MRCDCEVQYPQVFCEDVDFGRAVYKSLPRYNCFINSWHDIWPFLFWGPKLASLKHADPLAEQKVPSITLMNFIKQLKSVAMIYILLAQNLRPRKKLEDTALVKWYYTNCFLALLYVKPAFCSLSSIFFNS